MDECATAMEMPFSVCPAKQNVSLFEESRQNKGTRHLQQNFYNHNLQQSATRMQPQCIQLCTSRFDSDRSVVLHIRKFASVKRTEQIGVSHFHTDVKRFTFSSPKLQDSYSHLYSKPLHLYRPVLVEFPHTAQKVCDKL